MGREVLSAILNVTPERHRIGIPILGSGRRGGDRVVNPSYTLLFI